MRAGGSARLAIAVVLMSVGLGSARLSLSEKGFCGMAFLLALFATIAIQKNVRDSAAVAHRAHTDWLGPVSIGTWRIISLTCSAEPSAVNSRIAAIRPANRYCRSTINRPRR